MASDTIVGTERAGRAPQNGQGLAALYRSHAAWLRRWLATKGTPADIEADDVVQETYLRAARYDDDAIRRYPRALLARIATNVVRAHVRKAVVRRDVAAPMPANDLCRDRDAAALPDQEYLFMLKRIVLELPPDLRDVFLMSRFTTMTYDEIARRLGISPTTVQWRMSKALALCADALRD